MGVFALVFMSFRVADLVPLVPEAGSMLDTGAYSTADVTLRPQWQTPSKGWPGVGQNGF
jgi:hypothetical protein